jgi:hypothetical protein
MPRFQPPSVDQGRSKVGLIAAAAIGVAAALVVMSGIYVAVVANVFSHIGPAKPRRYLKPIPIAASACPYVRLMHAAADNFQVAQPVLGVAFDEHARVLPWPDTRARLDAALKSLEAAIQASEPQFPPQIQDQLSVTLSAVREGRVQLAVANDGADLVIATGSVREKGKLAFGYASDLVGKKCGVMLGADDSTVLYPFTTTTGPRSGPS